MLGLQLSIAPLCCYYSPTRLLVYSTKKKYMFAKNLTTYIHRSEAIERMSNSKDSCKSSLFRALEIKEYSIGANRRS